MIKHFEGYSVLVDTEENDLCILITENKDGTFEYDFYDVETERKGLIEPVPATGFKE